MTSPNNKSRRSESLSFTGTGAAVRRGDLKISDPIPFDEAGLAFNNPNTVPPCSYHQHATDATWPRGGALAHDVHGRHASDVQPHTGTRASVGPSVLQSSMSSIPSKGSLSQKRPGGLRAAIKRMFSSKKHRSVPTDTSGFQYSGSGRLGPGAENHQRTRLGSAPPFSADFATREAALASHATVSQAMLAFDQSLPTVPQRGRRNTLPSLVFSNRDSGLVPGLTEWPPAHSNQTENKTKEDQVSDCQIKRRSRSADALNDLVRPSDVERSSAQDRTSTIAFWRHSAIQNPVPVYSGHSIAVDPAHLLPISAGEQSQNAPTNMSVMQAFDFGLGTAEGDISLEQRLGTLEIKIFDFEFALAKLQGHNVHNPRLRPRPFSRGSVQHIFQQDATNTTSTTDCSSGFSYLSWPNVEPQPPFTFLSSPEKSPLPSPETEEVFKPQRASKATTATIRPATARRTSSPHSRTSSRSSIHIPARKFEALLDLVNDEKAARLRLEEDVKELQKEMETLRTPIYATIREAYPTPSPESSQNTPGTPRMRTLHRTQGFQLDHHPTPEISRFSGTQNSDGEDDYEDVYETPKEEQRDTFEKVRMSPRSVKA